MMGFVLVGCKTAADFYGKGPIRLSSNVEKGFERYKGGAGPEYFAISEDGKKYGWSFCRAGPGYCSGGGLPETIALQSCERYAKYPCKIYAKGKVVVWQGPVTRPGESQLGSSSIDVICAYALDYSSDEPTWSKDPKHAQYVADAKKQKLTIKQCDEIN